ncbi:molybdenum cofactor guanylyltransferase MobA [Burkholderia pseudomultivorans]|uniref:Molybdenum cofactor guanylyltransferase n=1 Tax=Burkholderia pseudomultivorans TaxID=1207504 RepID=A0ABU2EBI2_9BURK|nr:molybdenum cofactor guanylyltransferase MobA [Burkholderia pseudomultivorans]MDR8730471.1 Molybdenum cofactor guanylyltransferase [Burkholderia pseudomultivorans]MDR8738701.1 Molybdenum cofactor guanylyltransferase [Burkholderia pseudomultivorans]MDR8745206.1 Molybdenum cofactor guanylyltransferase [Burkholderia pseudomultivorans]MDR8757256.1 Molybdenum cofactor guanylyltransferase [Burkholderia pseudomultivorans]MDR8780904.1 Molybdenum cofactor guanylyltransferase [Burkholderia pseudomulti
MTASRAPSIAGLLLAGGRATRMDGVDKGLQLLDETPLALHVLRRLAPQVDELLISANRHPDRYAELGAPFEARVVPDQTPDFPGPLAGLLAGMRAARAPLVACAPCDSPFLPTDLVARLRTALDAQHADIAMAVSVDAQHARAPQPTFALLRTSLADDLAARLAAGDRKVRAWYARHKTVEVEFRDERAFYNANSWQELAALARR